MIDAAPAPPASGNDLPAAWLIVLAASSGGVKAVRRIVAALPRTLGGAVVVVQHRSPTVQNILPSILAMSGPVPVEHAGHGQPILRGRVYIGRPDLHLTITPDRRFAYADGSRIQSTLASADPLLTSAAYVFGDRLMAVVLTGRGHDASEGIRDVRALGGTVIAQDPATAEEPGMPDSAIRTGAVHRVLPLAEIAPAMVAFATQLDGHADETLRRRA